MQALAFLVLERYDAFRAAIMEGDHPPSHLVHNLIPPGFRPNPATVFRRLESLTKAGLANKVEFAGQARYELRTELHYHLACEECGRLTDVSFQDTPGLKPGSEPWAGLQRITKAHNFQVDRADLKLIGRCGACKRTTNYGDRPPGFSIGLDSAAGLFSKGIIPPSPRTKADRKARERWIRRGFPENSFDPSFEVWPEGWIDWNLTEHLECDHCGHSAF